MPQKREESPIGSGLRIWAGRGVMAFTDTGDTTNPSAAYAPIDGIVGVGPWNDVNGGVGAAQDDGFTSYKSQVGNPPRTRWGDYGSAAVDGNSIWIASEYIAHTCGYTTCLTVLTHKGGLSAEQL
jgi:hypothetical protein